MVAFWTRPPVEQLGTLSVLCLTSEAAACLGVIPGDTGLLKIRVGGREVAIPVVFWLETEEG